MDPGMFRGEEDIDKSKIIITGHAVDRFLEHIKKDLNSLGKMSRKRQNKFIGFYPLTIPKTADFCAKLIRQLLNKSSHITAASPIKRTISVIKYKRDIFFFRYGRWQFRVIHDKEKNRFVLVTVVWLDEKNYSLCFQ